MPSYKVKAGDCLTAIAGDHGLPPATLWNHPDNMDLRTRRGSPDILHVGDVLYGNIGVPERLQFTVVGPVANEVARIESLTKLLGHRVLVSGQFARNLSATWNSLGKHEVKGVSKPLEVFAGPPD